MSSEKDIIENLNRRDKEAVKQFFLQIYPSLCIVAQKYVAENDVAEDIAQESFIFYWENHKQFEELNALKGFLYVTVKNKCLNFLRLKKIRTELLKQKVETEGYLNEIVLEEETYAQFYKAIEKLPPQSRRIIELSLKGYKNPELAETLDISVNTVKTLKKNAYRVLRENLHDKVLLMVILNQILNQ